MSPPDFRVRIGHMGDYDALVMLFHDLDEFHRRARPDFFRRFDGPARTRRQIEQWLIGPGSTVLVAEREPEVIGLAVLLTRTPSPFAGAAPRKVVELDNIVVHSNWRGREVGRQLLEATMQWAHRQSATHVEVAVHAFNADARRFYERFGFAPSVDRLVIAA